MLSPRHQSPMPGRNSSADTLRIALQRSLFGVRNSLPIHPATFDQSIEQARMDQCIPKPQTRHSVYSSRLSTVKSTVEIGAAAGTKASSGFADQSSTGMAGCTFMRCYPLLQATSITYVAATPGTNGGTANSVAIKSNNRAHSAMFRNTFPSTSSKAAT